MKKKIEILSTVGPSTLNKDSLKYLSKKINVLRINFDIYIP